MKRECYEMNFEGKNTEEITADIVDAKNNIEALKNTLEASYSFAETVTSLERYDEMDSYREYLAKAKEALLSVGGSYELTKEEQAAEDFERNIPYICELTFSYGTFFDGYSSITYTVNGDRVDVNVELSPLMDDEKFYVASAFPKSVPAFYDTVRRLHMGEWCDGYSPERFGVFVLDGDSWQIEIDFSNGCPKKVYHGENAYPYNFSLFLQSFGIHCDAGTTNSFEE